MRASFRSISIIVVEITTGVYVFILRQATSAFQSPLRHATTTKLRSEKCQLSSEIITLKMLIISTVVSAILVEVTTGVLVSNSAPSHERYSATIK
jgi:hypothetical protein